MKKTAQTDYPIENFLKNRWSPRAFSPQPVEIDKLLSMFEAARWSPSGGNLQPWSFIVTTRENPDSFAKLLGTLGERNQEWAKNAPILVLTVAQREREAGKLNPWATYDLGQAVAHLSIQASILGLSVHQMGGCNTVKAAQEFELPEGYDPVTVIAIGYDGNVNLLPEGFRKLELDPRTRKPISEFVFNGAWKEPIIEKQSVN